MPRAEAERRAPRPSVARTARGGAVVRPYGMEEVLLQDMVSDLQPAVTVRPTPESLQFALVRLTLRQPTDTGFGAGRGTCADFAVCCILRC